MKMTGAKFICKPIHRSLIFFSMLLGTQLPCFAEINSSQLDSYLEREFNYSFSIDVDELPHYFKYKGSNLRPISRARVSWQDIGDSIYGAGLQTKKKLYEEFWYHRRTPLGYRKHCEVQPDRQQAGAVVIKHLGKRNEHANIAVNIALRILLDLQFNKMNAGVLIVPLHQYEEVALQLQSYRFAPLSKLGKDPGSMTGKQFSLNLRSYPGPREDLFFYLK